MMRTDPARYAVLIGNLLDAFGPDHILWCTDTPVIGPPRWQIEAFQGFTIPEAMIEQREFQPLTPEVKHKIFGRNAARIFGIDIVAARRGTEEAKNFAQAELAVQDCIVAPLVGSAPIPAGRGTEIERQGSTLFGHSSRTL